VGKIPRSSALKPSKDFFLYPKTLYTPTLWDIESIYNPLYGSFICVILFQLTLQVANRSPGAFAPGRPCFGPRPVRPGAAWEMERKAPLHRLAGAGHNSDLKSDLTIKNVISWDLTTRNAD